jgi:hypothetical protein
MAGEDVKVRMDAASNVGVDMMSILTLVVEMCATRTGLLLLPCCCLLLAAHSTAS